MKDIYGDAAWCGVVRVNKNLPQTLQLFVNEADDVWLLTGDPGTRRGAFRDSGRSRSVGRPHCTRWKQDESCCGSDVRVDPERTAVTDPLSDGRIEANFLFSRLFFVSVRPLLP